MLLSPWPRSKRSGEKSLDCSFLANRLQTPRLQCPMAEQTLLPRTLRNVGLYRRLEHPKCCSFSKPRGFGEKVEPAKIDVDIIDIVDGKTLANTPTSSSVDTV